MSLFDEGSWCIVRNLRDWSMFQLLEYGTEGVVQLMIDCRGGCGS